jgi:hypothetical protein
LTNANAFTTTQSELWLVAFHNDDNKPASDDRITTNNFPVTLNLSTTIYAADYETADHVIRDGGILRNIGGQHGCGFSGVLCDDSVCVGQSLSSFSDEVFLGQSVIGDIDCSHYLFTDFCKYKFQVVKSDYRNFYNFSTLGNLAIAIGGASILANTPLDQDFRNWFQRSFVDVNSGKKSVVMLSNFAKEFGEVPLMLFFVGTSLGYELLPFIWLPVDSTRSSFGKFTTLVTRAYLVGTPTNLLGQYILGGGRPTSGTSKWFNGKYNGISGHAFAGAIPFITAAQMTDNFWIKSIFYICSTFTMLSRIHDDAHYISQGLLGWYIAYLAVRAVSQSEGRKLPKGLTLFPIIEKNNVGAGFIYKF